MRVKHVIIIVGIIILWVTAFSIEVVENTLDNFGLSIGSLLIYILGIYFKGKIAFFIDKLLIFLKFQKPTINKVKAEQNLARYDGLLSILKSRMISFCINNLKEIEKGNLEYIKELNWRVRSNPEKPTFKGSLPELIRFNQKTTQENFLVIGEAGIGKTSSTFAFLLDLLENESAQLVPVYFSLSNWKKNQSIEQWMAKELDRGFHIEKAQAEKLIQSFKIFPFFDGLDQMSQEIREKNILEIYNYSKINPVAITSRPKAFIEANEYLEANGINAKNIFHVYELRPLSSLQVRKITKKLPNSAKFEMIINQSQRLKTLARYPMVLFILTQVNEAFNTDELNKIKKESSEEILELLWGKYDEFMFNNSNLLFERGISFNQKNSRRWLNKIASEPRSSFYIEELQPVFLESVVSQRNYIILSRMFQGILLSIHIGFFMSGPLNLIIPGILSGITASVIFILTKGSKKFISKNKDPEIWYNSIQNKFFLHFKNVLLYLIPLIILLGIYFGVAVPRSPEITGEMKFNGIFSITGSILGVLIALLMAFVFGYRASWQSMHFDIRPVEKISNDWGKFLRHGLFGGLSLGVFFIIVAYLINTLFDTSGFGNWLNQKLYVGNTYFLALIAGIIFGFFLFGLFGFLKEGEIKIEKELKKNIFTPNLGIKQTISNALKAAGIVSLIMVFFLGVSLLILEGEFSSVVKAVKTGLGFGFLAFLWFGGLDACSHYCLRLVIYLENTGPLNYIKFLEQASLLRFVRISGSSYEFTHPTLEQYFKSVRRVKSGFNIKKYIIVGIPIIGLFLIGHSINSRFNSTKFWQNPERGLKFRPFPSFIEASPGEDSQVIVTNIPKDSTIHLNIESKGKIEVGTFSGFVMADGTEAGFFGLKMSDIYDIPKFQRFRHGAVIVTKNNEEYRSFPSTDIFNLFSRTRNVYLKARLNDTILFQINDKEYQNNRHRFSVKIHPLEIDNNIQVISHRGYTYNNPENSLEAINEAIKLGVDKIEIDVRQTKDEKLVLMHDKRINRTTNGKGKVNNFDFNSLSQYYLDESENIIDTLRIPSLDQVFEIIKENNIDLLIELKNPTCYPELDKNLRILIDQYDLKNQVEVFSFDEGFIKEFKNKNPDIRVGVFKFVPFGEKNLENIDAVGIFYPSLFLKKTFLTSLKDKHIQVYAWGANSEKAMQELIKMKVDGIITDNEKTLLNNLR